MTIKNKIVAGTAALALALGMGLATAAPANASYGTCVSVGYVQYTALFLKMNGYYVSGGRGYYQCDINKVWVPKNTFYSIGGYIYHGGSNGYWQQISQRKTYYITDNVA